MKWSPALPMETALQGGEGGELDGAGGGRWIKALWKGKRLKVCRIFLLI